MESTAQDSERAAWRVSTPSVSTRNNNGLAHTQPHATPSTPQQSDPVEDLTAPPIPLPRVPPFLLSVPPLPAVAPPAVSGAGVSLGALPAVVLVVFPVSVRGVWIRSLGDSCTAGWAPIPLLAGRKEPRIGGPRVFDKWREAQLRRCDWALKCGGPRGKSPVCPGEALLASTTSP